MVYVYVDIRFYSQLRKIDGAFMDGLVSRMDESLSGANGKAVSKSPPFIYGFDDSVPGSNLQAAQAAFTVLEGLRASSSQLFGFSACLERMDEDSAEEIARRFRPLAFPPESMDSLVVGPTARGTFSEYFRMGDERIAGEVLEFAFAHPLSSDESQAFWDRPSLMSAMLDSIAPLVQGEGTANAALFILKRSLAPARALERAILPLAGPWPPFLVRPRPEAASPLAPIAQAVSRSDLAVARGRLGKTEASAFDSARIAFERVVASPFSKSFSDETARRFGLFIELFLSGLSRDRRARGFEPFVLVEDADRLPAASAALLARVAGDLRGENSPIFLLSCEDAARMSFEGALVAPFPAGLEAAMRREAAEYARSTASAGMSAEMAESIAAELFDAPLALYHALLLGRVSRNPTRSFIAGLPLEILDMLYAVHMASGIVDHRLLDDFFEGEGIRSGTRGTAFHQLFRMGLILSQDSRDPCFPETMDDIEIVLGERTAATRERFTAFLERLSASGSLARPLPSRARPVMKAEEALAAAQAVMDGCAPRDDGPVEDAVKVIRSIPPSSPLFSERECLVAWANAQRAMKEGAAPSLAAALSAFGAAHDDSLCALSCQRSLARAQAALAQGAGKEALAWAKGASMAARGPADAWEARSSRVMGMYFLRAGQILDAMDYFSNAASSAEERGDDLECCLGSYLEAATYFIHGNYSRASRLSEVAADRASRAMRPDWEAQAVFLGARIQMELGRPDRARAGFEACLCMARLGRSAALERRARAWLGRAMARGGSYAEALACFALAPKDAEAAFFRAEALVAMERYADAGTALSETEAIGYEKGPLYAEAPGFSSGFELVEDCLAGSDALALRSGALRADLERRQGALAQAAERLYGITRGRPGTELDPAYHEFLFMFFLTLPETGSPSPRSEFMSDRGTILSKAFKQLQLRASRIDSADDKNDYIARNPLNRSLTEIARTFKFI